MENRFKLFDSYLDPKAKVIANILKHESGEKQLLSYQKPSIKRFNADTIDEFMEEYYRNGENILIQITYSSPEFGDLQLMIQDRNVLHWMSETNGEGETFVSIRFLPNDFQREEILSVIHNNNIPGSSFPLINGSNEEFVDIGEVSKAAIIKFKFPKDSKFSVSEFPVEFPSSDGNPDHSQAGYLCTLDIIKPYEGDCNSDQTNITIRLGIAGPHNVFDDEDKKSAEENDLEMGTPKSEIHLLTDSDLKFDEEPVEDKDSPEFQAFQEKWFEYQNKLLRWKAIFGSRNLLIQQLIQEYSMTLVSEEELVKNPDTPIDVQVKLVEFEAWIKAKHEQAWGKYDEIIANDAVAIMQDESLSTIPQLQEALIDPEVKEKVKVVADLNVKASQLTVELTKKYAAQILSKDEKEVEEGIKLYKDEFMKNNASIDLKGPLDDLCRTLCAKCGIVAPKDVDLKDTNEYGMIYLTIPAIVRNYEMEHKADEKKES